MYLEGIMLSEISQTKKDKYPMLSFICEIKKRKKKELIETKTMGVLWELIETESRMVVAKGWEVVKMGR